MGASFPPVHAQKPPIPSVHGRAQKPELNEHPPTISLIQKESKHSPIPMSPNPRNIHRLGAIPATLVEFRRILALLCQGRWHPSLKPVTPESTSRRKFDRLSPFDDHAGLLCKQCTTSTPAQVISYWPRLELSPVRQSGNSTHLPRSPAIATTCAQRLPSTLFKESSRRLIAYKRLATRASPTKMTTTAPLL